MRPSPETDAKAPLRRKGYRIAIELRVMRQYACCGGDYAAINEAEAELEEIISHNERLEGQRDELLEALEDYFRPHGSCKTGACTRCDFEDKARAAIRKVRGEGKA